MSAAIKSQDLVSLPRYRACELCLHCDRLPSGRACAAPGVLAAPNAVRPSIELARAGHGACGPDARHLDMAAWA